MKAKGKVTIPTDESFVEGTKRIAALWGADAVRDCDGTAMPDEIKRAGYKIYSTYFVARGDNDFAKTVAALGENKRLEDLRCKK